MNKLRVIEGGGGGGNDGSRSQQPPDEKHLLAKSKSLRRIRLVLIKWRQGALPPHGANVLGLSALAFVSVMMLAWVAGSFGVAYNSLLVTAIAILCGVAAGFYVHRYGAAPRTHVDHLDRLLACYEPVAKDSYRMLQQKVKEQGAMDLELVEWWLELESEAIQVAAGWRLPSEGRFLKKKV